MMTLRIGYARQDITPPLGAYMSGYGYYLRRQAEQVMDPLFVRAVAAELGAERFILLDCDLLGLDAGTVAAVRQGLAALGVPWENRMILCTHTHTGPTVDARLEGCGEPNPEYVAGLAPLLVACARRALDDLLPVTSLTGSQHPIEPVGYNRADPDAFSDQQVRGIRVRRQGGADIALVSYACHPVTLGRSTSLSADFPGGVIRALEKQGMQGVFLNGICGDIDPVQNRTAWGTGTFETLEQYGGTIAQGFLDGLDAALPPTFSSFTLPITLNLAPMTQAEAEAFVRSVAVRCGQDHPQTAVAHLWLDKMKERLAGPDPFHEAVTVAVAVLGGAVIAAFPYEAFTVTGTVLRDQLPGRIVMALGNADQPLGYLPGGDDIARGSYASLDASLLYGRPLWLPGQAERLGQETGRCIAARLG